MLRNINLSTISLQREDRAEGGEEHRVVEGDVEEEKKRNGSTNARTCTSVVRAYKGADRRLDPEEHRRRH